LIQCARSIAASRSASASSCASARSVSGVTSVISRGRPSRSAATVMSICSRVGLRAARKAAASGPAGPS
jgi:hypothetical protein